jgi:hypothetical protein
MSDIHGKHGKRAARKTERPADRKSVGPLKIAARNLLKTLSREFDVDKNGELKRPANVPSFTEWVKSLDYDDFQGQMELLNRICFSIVLSNI